ncbi:MAG: hypothetical protein HN341_16820 [Verrucomicrobia bacterium]|nr:hypothetical protein [Verrucomicrobiota bacterium]
MDKRTHSGVVAGVLLGSVWAASEVALGTLLRTVALPLRGSLLTGIGVGILFAAFGYRHQLKSVAIALVIAVVAKVAFAPSFGFGITIINSSFAVLLEGACVIALLALLREPLRRHVWLRAGGALVAMLFAGTLFHAIGLHLAPCAYLKSLSAPMFFLRETVGWSLLSACTAPLGYAAGVRWSARYSPDGTGVFSTFSYVGVIAVCWFCCGITLWLQL